MFSSNQQNNKQSQNVHLTTRIIQIMKISDYLTLEKFQQLFIQSCVIQQINHLNCIVYLQETHKKLKNTISGASQAWYNLLNACIDYISHHLFEIYLNQTERIEKLHEKILGEILDRTIKYYTGVGASQKYINNIFENSNLHEQSKQKQIIFNLLMKSKKASSVDNLCSILKSNLMNKKINKKMHAKLSWKLHQLDQIKDQKIKTFKFFDMNWMLSATRNNQNSKGNLDVKLSLLPAGQREDNNIKKLNNNINGNSNIAQNSIGVFYIKLYWNIQAASLQISGTTGLDQDRLQTQGEVPLQINYICMKSPSPMNFFKIDPSFERKLFNKKLQLSIYCSTDYCYSFVMNYIINGYHRLRLDEKKMSKQEIYAIIQGSKSTNKHSQAIWLIKYLATNNFSIPSYLLQNLPLDKLPTYETEFVKKLLVVKNQKQVHDNFREIGIRYKQQRERENQTNSLSSSKISDNYETRSNKSNNSRSRHRKIFEQSPRKNISIVSSMAGNNISNANNMSNLNNLSNAKILNNMNIMVNNNSNNHQFDNKNTLKINPQLNHINNLSMNIKSHKDSINSASSSLQFYNHYNDNQNDNNNLNNNINNDLINNNKKLDNKLPFYHQYPLDEIMRTIDIRNYFYDTKSPIINMI